MNKSTLAVLSILLLMGCSSVPETRYYLLDYVPTPTQKRLDRGTWPYTLRVKDFRVAEAFRRNEIIYRQSAHQLKFYNFERWAVKPERLVTDMTAKHLKSMQLFRDVFRTLEDRKPDFVLSGEVTAIEEYDNENKWFAHLALNLSLTDSRTAKVVWTGNYDFRKEVKRQEPVYVVRALSFILESTLDKVSAELDHYLESHGS